MKMKPISKMSEAPVRASYLSKISPNGKSWKHRARKTNVDPSSSGALDNQKKRMGEGLARGSLKRARADEDDIPNSNEPTVEAVEQPHREP